MHYLDLILHLFTPRHSNGHRARALSPTAISVYIAVLLVLQISLSLFSRFSPSVLGYASHITVSDLLSDTNAKRAAAGVSALKLDGQLSAAAAAKGADMFANQYWAHVSPSGKDPWSFIVSSGYSYLFAGENLARDFNDSQAVVEAWMNSPTHKDNLLNGRFQEVGFAVVNGKYGSDETTVVVQMFGTRTASAPTVQTPEKKPTPPPPPAPVSTPAAQPQNPPQPLNPPAQGEILSVSPVPSSSLTKSKFDVLAVTKNISLALTAGLMLLLILDSVLVYKRKAIRVSGHNFAHFVFLLAALLALNLIGRGIIL